MFWSYVLMIACSAWASPSRTLTRATHDATLREKHQRECERRFAAVIAIDRVERFAKLSAVVERTAELVYGRRMIVDDEPVDIFEVMTMIRRTGVATMDELASATARAEISKMLEEAKPDFEVRGGDDDPFGALIAEYEYFLAMFQRNLEGGEAAMASWFLDELTERHAHFLRVKHGRR